MRDVKPTPLNDEDFDLHVWGSFGPKVRTVLAGYGRPDLEPAVKQRLRDFPAAWTTESIVEYVIGKAVSAEIDVSGALSQASA